MKIQISLTNRHAHLTKEHIEILFGKSDALSANRDIGAYLVSKETVTLKGPKGCIDGVRILYPHEGYSSYTQVEILQGDTYALGISAPLRETNGDNLNAAVLTIVGPVGEVTVPCAIVAKRHIHLDPQIGKEYGIRNGSTVQVRIEGERAMILQKVIVRYTPPKTGMAVMHLDMDEGNAARITNGSVGEILIY